MSGNVWEWQANYSSEKKEYLGLRGGSWLSDEDYARASVRLSDHPNGRLDILGFRVVAAPLPNG